MLKLQDILVPIRIGPHGTIALQLNIVAINLLVTDYGWVLIPIGDLVVGWKISRLLDL